MDQMLTRPHIKETKRHFLCQKEYRSHQLVQKTKKTPGKAVRTLRKMLTSATCYRSKLFTGRLALAIMRTLQSLTSTSLLACAVTLTAGTAEARKQPSPEPIFTFYQVDQKIQAKSAYLVDAKTNKVLFARNATKPFPPASTLKLMTALLAYENRKQRVDHVITVVPSDTKVEPSHIPLVAGEQVQVDTLIKALLVGSDNDSAMALARYSAGSVPAFVDMMNQKCKQIGCQNTRFVNPHGLPASGQFTTAMDLLRIFQATIRVPELKRISSMPAFRMETEVGAQIVRNHNKLLGRYEGMGAAKTGWTVSSKHTYAASASRNGQELHLVILNSPNKWKDAKALFDYGFQALSLKPTVSSVSKSVKPSPEKTPDLVKR